MTRKQFRSTAKLSTLDDFLRQEGKLEEFEAVAIQEVPAWQIGEAMKAKKSEDEDGARSAYAVCRTRETG